MKGGARLVCSVLFWPPAEFSTGIFHGSPPGRSSFADLQHQLDEVERALEREDNGKGQYVIAHSASDLDKPGVVFVHCVEGGFHLGPDEDAIDANVAWLAEKGVVYITVAHLFFRGVAADAPAIPMIPDDLYNRWFPQPKGLGLTHLGCALVRAMYKHRVLVDISHMRQDAIDQTFELVEALDRETGRDPSEYPIIATHVAMRDVSPNAQAYNLTAATVQRIKARGGVVGVIMAQHQAGEAKTEAESQAVLRRQIDAINAAAHGHEHTAIGTDIDGFIKPTLAGIETAEDFKKLQAWIEAEYPGPVAQAILYGNARRVIGIALNR